MKQPRPFLPPTAIHYGFVVAGVTFLCLLGAAGLRAVPGVILVPLQLAFTWDREMVSLAAGVGLLVNGLVAPFAGALMQRFGIRRVLLCSLVLMAASTGLSLLMTSPWHYLFTWGVLSGVGSGAVGGVLAASVVSRWFARQQGLVMGVLSASTATGSLIFLPLMASLTVGGAWKPVVMLVAVSMAFLVPVAWLLMRESPNAMGTHRYGAGPEEPAPQSASHQSAGALRELARGARDRTFWLLVAGFFVCGFTTNGLIGTHLIAFCGDHGISPVVAAQTLALMGLLDIAGSVASGWLTDRYNPRLLLALYFSIRGISLLLLPSVDLGGVGFTVFSVVFGLNWLATVPPTLAIVRMRFGEIRAPVIYGWIFAGHQAGAAAAAYGAGVLREVNGSYMVVFTTSGALALVVAAVFGATSLRRPLVALPPAVAHSASSE